MKSRLAAISLECKQPKTHPKVGTERLVRSNDLGSFAVEQNLGLVKGLTIGVENANCTRYDLIVRG